MDRAPRRLHGHARHGHELPRAAGLPGEAGRRDPGADRDHDGPGRRAVHPAPGDPAPREGPRRHLRRRPRRAVLLHRHRRPRSARWRSAPRSCSWPRASTASTTPTRARTRTRTKFDQLTYAEVLARGLKVADATAFSLCMDNDAADHRLRPARATATSPARCGVRRSARSSSDEPPDGARPA